MFIMYPFPPFVLKAPIQSFKAYRKKNKTGQDIDVYKLKLPYN